jgi:isohexenylglutaconyl-CoA hydratase
VVPPGAEIGVALEELLYRVRRVGPRAAAATKRLLLRVGEVPIDALLDEAAAEFAAAARSREGREGMAAFVEKRAPAWARELKR